MRILILGGTIFLGRHFVEAAQARGHEVTLFHRGKHGADLFPDVERILGDRDGGLAALDGRTWDAVVDTCGYVPRVVEAAAHALADRVERYVFVSTLSVYPDSATVGLDETAPVGTLEDPTTEVVDGATYGPLKALCEQAAEKATEGRALTIRPGLIVGPHDPSDRFTWWPWRLARGGEVPAPEHPGCRIQWIDVRDLATWMVAMVEAREVGVFNAIGPEAPATFGDLFGACAAMTGVEAKPVWLDAAFLDAEKIQPYMDLPLWVPDVPEHAGFSTFSLERALQNGLTLRPLEETVDATWRWAQTRPDDHAWRAGLDPEREAALLRTWSA